MHSPQLLQKSSQLGCELLWMRWEQAPAPCPGPLRAERAAAGLGGEVGSQEPLRVGVEQPDR